MAKKRGILRRLIETFFRPAPTAPPPSQKPAQQNEPSTPSAPTRRALENRAVRHFLAQIPLANIDTVKHNVQYMTLDELRWTMRATAMMLVRAAMQNADRLTKRNLPLNPWWYH